MNFMSKGIAWFNEQRAANVVEDVVIKTSTIEKTVKASIVEPESFVNGQGLKVQSDKYIFLIEVAYLTGVNIARGVQIFRNGELYEVVQDKSSQQDYNDPENTVRSIPAQKRCYSAP